MDADTPKRSATAPTFSASPTFLLARAGAFLRSGLGVEELLEALDKAISTWPPLGKLIICFLSIAATATLAARSRTLSTSSEQRA